MRVRAAGFAFLVLLTGACAPPSGGPSGGPPDEPPYIDGTITQINTGTQGVQILVEEAGGGNQAAVTVTAETVVVQEFGGGYEPASLAHLRQGQHVGVWTTSPVRESFPVQVTPSGIVIRER